MPKPRPIRRALGGSLGLAALLLVASQAQAATQDHEARSSDYLTVCADPNNLPLSNDQEAGYENRIAQLIGAELGRPLHYRWWPQTIGFVRNTLRVRLCDLITGITSVSELVQNTNPYYRSVYTLAYRADSGLKLDTLRADDPALQGLRIGVVAGTPPVSLLTRFGLLGQIRSYERSVDTRRYSPARDAIADVAAGETDLAIVWGPIAGYYGPRQAVPLEVVPLPAEIDGVPLAFNVSMGLRHRESAWKHQLNAILERLAPEIERTLLSYGVPLLDQRDQLIQP